MATTSGGFNPASDAPCYNPRMTRAAALALRAANGLRENCVVVITDGPVIGVAGNVSGTEITLQPVAPNQFGMEALVFQGYDNTAWQGLYDIDLGTGTLLRLEDNLGNIVDDPTGANMQAFPWGYATVNDNRINGDAVLINWGPAAQAGAFIHDNDIAASAVAAPFTTVDLVGLKSGDRFATNEVNEGAFVVIQASGGGQLNMEGNEVSDGFRLRVNQAAGTTTTAINGNAFRGNVTPATVVDHLRVAKTAGSFQIDQSDFDANGDAPIWVFSGAGNDQVNLSKFRAATPQITASQSVGNFVMTRCDLDAGNLSIGGAGGNVTLLQSTFNSTTITRDPAATGAVNMSRCTFGMAVINHLAGQAGGSTWNDVIYRDGVVTQHNSVAILNFFNSTIENHNFAAAVDINHAGSVVGAQLSIGDSIIKSPGNGAAPTIDNQASGGSLIIQRSDLNGTRVTRAVGTTSPVAINQSRLVDTNINLGATNNGTTNVFQNVDSHLSTFNLNGPVAAPARNDYTAGAAFSGAVVTVAATATAGISVQGGRISATLTQNRTAGTGSTTLFDCDLRGGLFTTFTDNGTTDPGVGMSVNRIRMVDSAINLGNVTGKTLTGTILQQVEMVGSVLNVTSAGSGLNDFSNRVFLFGASLTVAPNAQAQDVTIQGAFTKVLTAFNFNRLCNKAFDDVI